jgi:diguanylate cyclase (GGDEF)-like protein
MDLGERKVLEFRGQVLGLYLVIASVAALTVIPTYFFIGIDLLVRTCVVYAIVIIATTILFSRRKIGLRAATNWFLGTTVMACMIGLYLGDELIDNKPWQFVIPVAAFTVAGWRAGLWWSAASLVMALAIYALRWPAYELLSIIVMAVAYATTASALCVFNRHNESNIRTIARLSHTDSLTGSFNRQLFDELSLNEFNRSLRAEEPLAIYMIDIDHFKKFNDHYGHVAGDQALAAVARLIRNTARRASDLVFRYGGEEFCVISSGLDGDDARSLAVAIIDGVRELAIEHAQTERGILTVSVGLSQHEFLSGESVESLLKLADSALYEAKLNGRDRLEQKPPATVGREDFLTDPAV